ncbi:FtsQ-type POTRA domain-containing protein [Candidatus Nomurabacteria bacterium]|nr:FtsQ-type POTRA domain-containing protein [Candidatus Nomurabacteria bacterium]
MRIQSRKTWQQHLPNRTRKVSKNYYYKKGINKKNLIKKIVLVILFLLLVQSLFQLPFLRINKFVLSNNQDLKQEDLQSLVSQYLEQDKYLLFKNNNYFLFDQSDLKQDLLNTYNLDSVSIQKKFPQTIEIKVTEKISQFILQKDDALYLLSSKGALNRQINALDEKYLILQDFRSDSLNLEQILNEDELELINFFYKSWQETFGQSPKLKTIFLTDSLDTLLEAQTDIGYTVKLDPEKNIIEQLNNLKKVLAGNIIGIDIDYIDLRFGERVFFK